MSRYLSTYLILAAVFFAVQPVAAMHHEERTGMNHDHAAMMFKGQGADMNSMASSMDCDNPGCTSCLASQVPADDNHCGICFEDRVPGSSARVPETREMISFEITGHDFSGITHPNKPENSRLHKRRSKPEVAADPVSVLRL